MMPGKNREAAKGMTGTMMIETASQGRETVSVSRPGCVPVVWKRHGRVMKIRIRETVPVTVG